jgi:hypothetical protein
MSDQKKYTEDLLRHYIYPENIEKAPEGFTSKVMSNVQLVNSHAKDTGMVRNRSLIPVISAAVTILFMASAFLIPAKSEILDFPAMALLKSFKVSLPQLDLTSIFRFNVPLTVIYSVTGILVLTLLDKALSRLFRREK